MRTHHGVDAGAQLLGQRLDDRRAKSGLWLFRMAPQAADSIVGNREPPMRFGRFISNRHTTAAAIAGESMFERASSFPSIVRAMLPTKGNA